MRKIHRKKRKRLWEDGGRNWSYVATSQRLGAFKAGNDKEGFYQRFG
jgi:hypothetical protein